MKYFPIFLKFEGKRVILSGGGETAVAKLRLLLKTEAVVEVFALDPNAQIQAWAKEGRVRLHKRELQASDIEGALVVYGANENDLDNSRIYEIAKAANVLVNIVDSPEFCDFITPAIVDRDPVVVAIGTEGAAPVVARQIKARLEADLSPELGSIVKVAQSLRSKVARLSSERRRAIWTKFFNHASSFASKNDAVEYFEKLRIDELNQQRAGFVTFVGAGPGDPELLTLKARKALHEADVVLYDRLVDSRILELVRREAVLIETGKKGYGESWKQEDINALMIEHAKDGAHVIRLKSGDPVIYGRLDEEVEALEINEIAFTVIPGISAAHAAAASIGRSLTQRGRNSELRILTGHDVEGFAEHDWRTLAKNGQCAAIYMGAQIASQIRGRLLMYGADPQTPVTAVENVSRPYEKIIASNLLSFPEALTENASDGPIVILYGVSREQIKALELPQLKEATK